MNERYVLEASARDIVGKKVKQLRAQGRIPGVIYGKTQEPVHVEMDWPNLRVALLEAGGSHLVDVKLPNETYTTLIRVVDRHPVRRHQVLHVDFYAVNLKEKLVSSIPLVLVGMDEARSHFEGRIVQDIITLDVESLPSDIPEEILVDVRGLKKIGEVITVADLPVIEGVTFVDEPETIVIRTDHLRVVETTTTDDEEEETTFGDTSHEPEVISRGKDEEDED